MITPDDLTNRAVTPADLSDRQREVVTLIRSYYAVAHELPSAGWLSRRMKISRERARQHIDALRRRNVSPLAK